MSMRLNPYLQFSNNAAEALEFYKGVVYLALDIPKELFTACFAAARIFGWVAHVVEQRQDNRLIRPTALYVGPPPQPA